MSSGRPSWGSLPVERVAAALGCRQVSGKREWRGNCPICKGSDDTKFVVSVMPGTTDVALMKCYKCRRVPQSGRSLYEFMDRFILPKLGGLRDTPSPHVRSSPSPAQAPQPEQPAKQRPLPRVGDFLARDRKTNEPFLVSRIHHYLRMDGSHSGIVVLRGETADRSKKTIRQLSMDPATGMCTYTVKGRQSPPYGSERIKPDTTHLLLVEGEKCVDAFHHSFDGFNFGTDEHPIRVVAISARQGLGNMLSIGGNRAMQKDTDWGHLKDVIGRMHVLVWGDSKPPDPARRSDSPNRHEWPDHLQFERTARYIFADDLKPISIAYAGNVFPDGWTGKDFDLADAVTCTTSQFNIAKFIHWMSSVATDPDDRRSKKLLGLGDRDSPDFQDLTLTGRVSKPVAGNRKDRRSSRQAKIEASKERMAESGRTFFQDTGELHIGRFLNERGFQFRSNEDTGANECRIPTGTTFGKDKTILTHAHAGRWEPVENGIMNIVNAYIREECSCESNGVVVPVEFSMPRIMSMAVTFCGTNPVRPMRDFVMSCEGKWDGEERITRLRDILWPEHDSDGNEIEHPHDNEILMISYMAVFGCNLGLRSRAQICPILVGEGGIGKSTFVDRILPPDIMSDNPAISYSGGEVGADGNEHAAIDDPLRSMYAANVNFTMPEDEINIALRYAWTGNWDECAGFTAHNREKIIKRISQPFIQQRLKYERNVSSHRNSVVFFGSSNNANILPRQEVEGRRFFIIALPTNASEDEKDDRVKFIDAYMEENRVQMVAEALHRLGQLDAGSDSDMVPSAECRVHFRTHRQKYVYINETANVIYQRAMNALSWIYGDDSSATSSNHRIVNLHSRWRSNIKIGYHMRDVRGQRLTDSDGRAVRKDCIFVTVEDLRFCAGIDRRSPRSNDEAKSLSYEMKDNGYPKRKFRVPKVINPVDGYMIPLEDLSDCDALMQAGFVSHIEGMMVGSYSGRYDSDVVIEGDSIDGSDDEKFHKDDTIDVANAVRESNNVVALSKHRRAEDGGGDGAEGDVPWDIEDEKAAERDDDYYPSEEES